ncbi:MAG TPA: metallophosphoesterase, partial [Candidatus Sulfotelmatobacter sp.]|nr:metallophosphoesterase [Candidatus Sulfotelmatobacter sp.]
MTPSLRIVQISDLHLLGEPGRRINGVDSGAVLERTVPLLNELKPDVIVATGDLTDDGSPGAYRRLRRLLAPLAARLHACPGNHDDRQVLRRDFGLADGEGPAHESFATGGVRFILLDSTVAGDPAGHLAECELSWLEAE